MPRFRVLGRALQREDGRGKVTGQAQFTADIIRPGMLWGKILRSPLAHARIVNLDTRRARNLPGVKAVITAQDVSPKLTGRTLADLPILARERVRFVGDKMAAVAASDKDTAEAALSLIEVEYEELPAVFDPLEALKPEAPVIHPDYASYEAPETRAPDLHNVQSVLRAKKGDIEKGFRESDKIFEDRFQTQMVHQGYIEPYACSVEIDDGGRILAWASTQSPFSARDQLARLLELPKESVIFHPILSAAPSAAKII